VDAIPRNAALMTRKGVVVSVNSDSAEHARRLNTEAAKSEKWGGLNDDEALALVTINPAKQLLTDPKEFVRNAAKAVKAGLAPDAAIRALTLNAATIAGAADRLGSIEKDKIANLVVTDGDLFDEKTKVTRVFVNGRAVALDAPVPAPGGRGRGGGRGGD
jgi:imidazolonepropionase-like amidohydrolase